MIAEIITIGDELLIGQVIDTNSAWMATKLNEHGIGVKQITSISDNREHILTTLKEASQRANLILITGGLGPTKDDITKTTLCEYFSTGLVFSEIAYKGVSRLFRNRGLTVTDLNRQQAMVPENCTVIPNSNGTAPGMWFQKDEIIYVSMPGVPFEMKAMMENEVLPRLAGKSNYSIIHRTILTEGIGESFLAAKIASWENNLPSEIKLAYLPQPGMVRLRLTAKGTDKLILEKELKDSVDELFKLAGEYIFGEGEETLQNITGQLLKKYGKTLATAESCTGGYLAHLITSISGSSEYFKGSVIAYANEIKERMLGVEPETLAKHGAVSEETVKQMAEGIRSKFKVDYAVATSGIAGPTGGSPEKPVGTTWIAIASPSGTIAKKFMLGDHRERNIQRAAISALSLLRKKILEDFEK
ncbi:MAG TPA: competence/damage-inducible protein A [Bacteroidales bacterium]|nr:competence/damage-inducible protein A [Bacteroidales bacterium]